jgi:hypothetical protein
VNQLKIYLTLISLSLLVSCNEEQKCEQEYVTSYQRMGDAFSALYSPKSGSFELNNLRNSITAFIADHEDVVCDLDGDSMDLTGEVKAFLSSLPKSVAVESRLVPKVVYGGDDRINVSAASGYLQSLARSTAAQISPSKWDSNFNLVNETLGKRLSLCPGEKFEDEVSVSRCSGFLVGPDTIVTAGHCVQSEFECSEYRWVFDYKDNPSKVKPENIYQCQSIVKQVLDNNSSLDYAVIKLDRAVSDRKFFRVRSSGDAEVGAPLVVIGHPSGLSTKIADNAEVRRNSDANFFVANLDVFGGNSGSAVLAANSSTVEGILVRGEEDYIVVDGPDGGRCRRVNQCSDSGCNGEEVTKMTSVEGIQVIDDFSVIENGLFISKTFPSIQEGLPISFLGYSFGNYTIGGLKFLDRCGVHFYESSKASQWVSFHVGECSDKAALKTIVSEFGDQFYF